MSDTPVQDGPVTAGLTPADLELAQRREIDTPSSKCMRCSADEALPLDSGVILSPWQIAYETYGTLNADRSNAILICHALTGDQYVASTNPVTRKPGWWTMLVGPGSRSIRTATSSSARTCSVVAWAPRAPRRPIRQRARPMR